MKRTILLTLITLCSCLAGFCPKAMAAKRALVFGLGQQEDATWTKINGDKDAAAVSAMLRANGFRDITLLTNEKATKQGMAQAFLDLTKRCIPGDVVYVHYSGHGQLMTDLNGDEAERWKGRKHAQWDEAWVPYDAYMTYCKRDDGRRHFCDDDVERFLTAIRKRIGSKGRLYVVIDACHSGDATRGDLEEEPVRGVDLQFIIPRKPDVPPAKPKTERWLTISACKPYQLCFEHKGQRGGKLTTAICELGPKLFTMTNSELEAYLQQYINEHPGRLTQTPMVTGKR